MAIRVLHDWRGLDAAAKGAAVALGNFDGVHRGHQRVIADAAKAAGALGVPLGVISFEPHPRRLFQPTAEPFRLMTPHQQARALGDLGVDLFYLLPFGVEMAGMSDETFAREVLAEGLGARHVAAGFDITFGKGRTGDPAALRRYGEAFGFSVSVAEALGDDEADKFSSSAVREALHQGHPERAAKILGRPFAIEGVVVKGQQLGRQLGFPTANVPMGDYVLPRLGVYATRTRLPDGREAPGVANIGVNPTTGLVEPRLEVWLFDFDEDIYGQTIETDLIAFLRPELKFDGLDALVKQVNADAAVARAILMPDL
ncbi:bifunctional riboflavin kinase/FMN adenylyltransferase [Caulobacter sp. CCUG 60055]|uniref:bifunctional riboflavin kinase/FAD synthetase n=1 Tax=Caulobacter sp. CCUG 60055 TaxID=2100090 RepID=UPI001FA7A79E|nr:bifunctional riboflavin kinase/FMN adenylyltransferase [Caulobacter sp. CCUG 60055]